MSDEIEVTMVSIYVLPSVPTMPPRALLFEGDPETSQPIAMPVWSADSGTWLIDGVPVQPMLAEAITEHAKSLGVDW